MEFLTTNTKLAKSKNVVCVGIQLAPYTTSGHQVCPMASLPGTALNWLEAEEFLHAGGTVCIVFDNKAFGGLPSSWRGWPVVDNDIDDCIWTRPPGHILGAKFKGNRSLMRQGCAQYCIYRAGHGNLKTVQNVRIERTQLIAKHPGASMIMIKAELSRLTRLHKKLATRLNVFSDLSWELMYDDRGRTLFELFPKVQFYDYTKIPKRMKKFMAGNMPENYHLTFSLNHVVFE